MHRQMQPGIAAGVGVVAQNRGSCRFQNERTHNVEHACRPNTHRDFVSRQEEHTGHEHEL